jgi:hypothetical protein
MGTLLGTFAELTKSGGTETRMGPQRTRTWIAEVGVDRRVPFNAITHRHS